MVTLTACSSDDPVEPENTTEAAGAEAEDEPAEEDPADEDPAEEDPVDEDPAEEDPADEDPAEEDPADDEGDEGPAAEASGGYTPAPWALPVTEGGDLIATVEAGDVVVEVYQIGVTQATKTGFFVDPEDNQPIIDVGDDIVYVNYVITNTGDPIDLGSSLVQVNPKYDDWPFMQGMDSITDFELVEEMGVNRSEIAPGEVADPPIYVLGSGESYSIGDNFHYQEGSPITFSVRYTPVDDEGDLVHDERVDGEGAGTIQ